jgi:hypothetical protein
MTTVRLPDTSTYTTIDARSPDARRLACSCGGGVSADVSVDGGILTVTAQRSERTEHDVQLLSSERFTCVACLSVWTISPDGVSWSCSNCVTIFTRTP